MDIVGMVSLVFAVWSIFILNSLDGVYAINAEGAALLDFRKNLVDPQSSLRSWDGTLPHPCTWFHVTCNSADNVTNLDLGGSGLSGTLGTSLSQLTNLVTLSLYDNNLTGGIGMEFGDLINLQQLNLYNNKLFGSIPYTLGNLTKLTRLDLHQNSFVGNIPAELGNLFSLQVLDLSANGLTGPIPNTLPKLNNLVSLILSDNALEGRIVDDLGKLEGLSFLNLSFNNLYGTLPEWWSNVTVPNLKTIDLSHNDLRGSFLSPSWVTILVHSYYLDLSNNKYYTGACNSHPCRSNDPPPEN